MISILIPYYNKSNTIDKVFRSIENAKKVTPSAAFEVIIVDDGSALKELDSLMRESIRLGSLVKIITKPNGGVSSARNLALENSSGKYVYFLDADDLIDEFFFKNINKVDFHQVFCLKVNNFKRKPFAIGQFLIDDEIFLNMYDKRVLHLSSFLFLKDKISTKFDESITVGEDILFIYENIIGKDLLFSDKYIGMYCYDGKFHHSKLNGIAKIADMTKSLPLKKQLNLDVEFKSIFHGRMNGEKLIIKDLFKFSLRQSMLLLLGSGSIYKFLQKLRHVKSH